MTTIQTAILETLDDWGVSPENARGINEGECMEFVNQILLEYDNISAKRMTTEDLPEQYIQTAEATYKPEPYHEWLTDGDKHYDAECPEGVNSWKQLPFFKRTLGL